MHRCLSGVSYNGGSCAWVGVEVPGTAAATCAEQGLLPPATAPAATLFLCLQLCMYNTMYAQHPAKLHTCVPKYCSASTLMSWVLPTPVGPTKSMLAAGLDGSFSPTRARHSAPTSASTAASCPMMRDLSTGPCKGWVHGCSKQGQGGQVAGGRGGVSSSSTREHCHGNRGTQSPPCPPPHPHTDKCMYIHTYKTYTHAHAPGA